MNDTRRPLLGFGPVGWVAATAVVVLLTAVAAGVDVQSSFLRLIGSACGSDALYRFTLSILPFVHWHTVEPQFSLVSSIYLTIALFLTPAASGWSRWTAVWAWPLLQANPVWGAWVMLPLMDACSAVVPSGPAVGFGGSLNPALAAQLAIDFASTAVIAWLFRSWRVGACVAALSLATALVRSVPSMLNLQSDLVPRLPLLICWHAGAAGIVIAWAVARRRAFRPVLSCGNCGHTLLARASVCPECGVHEEAA